MSEEMKIKIQNLVETEQKLIQAGAEFLREIICVDTHFKTSLDRVLKIAENGSEGNFLVDLSLEDGKFKIVKYEPIVDFDETKKILSETYGIKRVITKRRRFFKLNSQKIQTCIVGKLGKFLIIEGKNLAPEYITEELKIENPEFVEKSFDRLFDELEY